MLPYLERWCFGLCLSLVFLTHNIQASTSLPDTAKTNPVVGTVEVKPVEKAGLRQLVVWEWSKLAASKAKSSPPHHFRVGSTVPEVLAVMGRPTRVTRWSLFYGKSRIDFDPSSPVPVVQGYEVVDQVLLVFDP